MQIKQVNQETQLKKAADFWTFAHNFADKTAGRNTLNVTINRKEKTNIIPRSVKINRKICTLKAMFTLINGNA